MAVSLWAVAITGAAVAVATWNVITLTREENREKDRALDEYQTATGLQLAEANERAAEANLKAETERVERLKLEAKYAPRILSPDQVSQFIAVMAPLRGKGVDIVSYESLGTDVATLARQLQLALTAAGIKAEVYSPFAGSGLVFGTVVRTEVGSMRGDMDTLVQALKSADLSPNTMPPYPKGEDIAGGFMGPTGLVPSAKLRLLVGAKPQPTPGLTAAVSAATAR
jgi:hypothetical protein